MLLSLAKSPKDFFDKLKGRHGFVTSLWITFAWMPKQWGLPASGVQFNYLAYSMALVSRSRWTLI